MVEGGVHQRERLLVGGDMSQVIVVILVIDGRRKMDSTAGLDVADLRHL
jgi:hypothetical protein